MSDRSPPPVPGHLPSSFDTDADFHNERPMQKVVRKLKEEPLVPLGIGLTVFAFVNAYRAIRRGDSHQANRMFRARVAAQGFTVIAMVAGSMYYSQDRQKTKELRKLKEEKDAEEKRQRWIQELEARDDEEKRMRDRLRSMRPRGAGVAAESQDQQGAEAQGTGGILGKMGLWKKGEEKAEEARVMDDKGKRQNPKSSLGAIGEVLNKDKENETKK
ncbi:uncharacterized protein UV8b_01692 [Ustilaginoidea virens]|uniref:HIG1 domain-containing protein n=1 Tax=Ustilaginoidea virens TaxID=1159556 RepID=A0A8E5MFF7_USTVR|nr:uncharacterized protein UV8b_01692 [Ustilaginoidea virens]QUC17451.1 hypothetical protein UV8b_01692 [Ustilaginoidea virens]